MNNLPETTDCPVCGESAGDSMLTHNDTLDSTVKMYYYLCRKCGSEYSTELSTKVNVEIVRRKKGEDAE